MVRLYAVFSSNHPIVHGAILLLLGAFFGISVYQLLVHEALIFLPGIFLLIIPMIFFAKASDYKRKYLHD